MKKVIAVILLSIITAYTIADNHTMVIKLKNGTIKAIHNSDIELAEFSTYDLNEKYYFETDTVVKVDTIFITDSIYIDKILTEYDTIYETVTNTIHDTVHIYDSPVMVNGHEFVDLGLPSGTLWATSDVGAKEYEVAGTLFTIDEMKANITNGYINSRGSTWKMPTKNQFLELIENCDLLLLGYDYDFGDARITLKSKINNKKIGFEVVDGDYLGNNMWSCIVYTSSSEGGIIYVFHIRIYSMIHDTPILEIKEVDFTDIKKIGMAGFIRPVI